MNSSRKHLTLAGISLHALFLGEPSHSVPTTSLKDALLGRRLETDAMSIIGQGPRSGFHFLDSQLPLPTMLLNPSETDLDFDARGPANVYTTSSFPCLPVHYQAQHSDACTN